MNSAQGMSVQEKEGIVIPSSLSSCVAYLRRVTMPVKITVFTSFSR